MKSTYPDRRSFGSDPFGYSACALDTWRLLQNINGFERDMEQPPTREELNSPVLWLCQARALSEAASAVIKNQPNFYKDDAFHSICDSQYCAAGLMLIGYSLEICLKGTLIVKEGLDAYLENEEKRQHHRLEKLSDYMPNLNKKDVVILRTLSDFTTWAGRYPTPKPGKEGQREQIFQQSLAHKITTQDLFDLSAKVMRYSVEIMGHDG